MLPQVPLAAQLGIRQPELAPGDGEAWFRKQSLERQQAIMGKGMQAAYADGAVRFDQMSRTYQDKVYGDMRRMPTMEEVLGGRAREFARDAAGKGAAVVVQEPPGYVQQQVPAFKNKTDAEQWMQANIADKVMLSRGADADGLRAIAQAVSDVDGRFGLPRMTYLGDPTKYDTKIRGFSPKVLAAYVHNKNALVFSNKATDAARIAQAVIDSNANTVRKSPMAGLRAALESGINAGRYDPELLNVFAAMTERKWFVVESIEDITFHEMGHRLSDLHPDAATLHSISNRVRGRGWATVLSEYAKTNNAEFISESFAAYMKGDISRLNPEMVAWFRKHDGGVP